jgi:hypothetical protein
MAKSRGGSNSDSLSDAVSRGVYRAIADQRSNGNAPMSEVTTLGQALGEIVDEIMRAHDIDVKKHPVVRQILYQVAACTASLMVKHYTREQAEHEEVQKAPWTLNRPKSSNNVH